MVASLKQLFRLWRIYAWLDLLWFLRDTRYCIAAIVSDVIANLSAIAGVFLLAERFGNIGGMNKSQVLFMLGYACTVDGVIQMFFNMNNVAWISRLIGRGQLDHRLLQPVPLWMQLATEGFLPVSGNSTLLCGLGLTLTALHQLGRSLHLLFVPGFLLAICCSVGVVLSFSYIFGSIAFYAPVAAEEISTTALGLFAALKSFPIGGLSLAARTLLCTAVPVGLAAWFPANLLLGQALDGLPDALLLIMTAVLVVLAATLFRKGLRYYAKRGSVRYTVRGHRR
ncbi:MAG: ABC-2 family transporter protein [Bacillota bacterium]|jgi:ABC-2 type transport system permease protein